MNSYWINRGKEGEVGKYKVRAIQSAHVEHGEISIHVELVSFIDFTSREEDAMPDLVSYSYTKEFNIEESHEVIEAWVNEQFKELLEEMETESIAMQIALHEYKLAFFKVVLDEYPNIEWFSY